MPQECINQPSLPAFKKCIYREWYEFYSNLIVKSGLKYDQKLRIKRPKWYVIYLANPLKQYQRQALVTLSSGPYEGASDNVENSFTNQHKLCSAAAGYMLRASSRYDHKMRTKLVSYNVKLKHYFNIELPCVPGDFRNVFFAIVQSTTFNKKANSLDALGRYTIFKSCKTVLAELSKRLIIDLKEQVAAARVIVQRQYENKGNQKMGALLAAWPKLELEIEAFSKEVETVAVTRPETEFSTEDKEEILVYFQGLFSTYHDDISKKATNIYDDLVLFNYVLLQKLDVGNNIDLDC